MNGSAKEVLSCFLTNNVTKKDFERKSVGLVTMDIFVK